MQFERKVPTNDAKKKQKNSMDIETGQALHKNQPGNT